MQLILNTFGTSLRKQDGMFLIMANEKKALLSPEKVDSILLATGVHLSTDVIRLAIEHHIDIVLLDSVGEHVCWIRPHLHRPCTLTSSCSTASGNRMGGSGMAGPGQRPLCDVLNWKPRFVKKV